MTPHFLAFVPILLPLLTALLVFGIDRIQAYFRASGLPEHVVAAFADLTALAGSGITFMVLLKLLLVTEHDPFETTLFSWIPRASFDLSFTLRVNNLALFFINIACFTTFGILLATAHGLANVAARYFPERNRRHLRLPAPLPARMHAGALAVLGLFAGICLSANLLIFYLFWALLALFIYLLLLSSKESDTSIARHALLVMILSGYGLLAAALILGNNSSGTFLYPAIRPVFLSRLPLGLLLVAAAGISGLYPLSAWPVKAGRGSAVAAAIIHAITLPAGIFLLLRAQTMLAGPFPADISFLILLVAVLTIAASTLRAWKQKNLRRLLSYHSITTLGYALLGIGLGSPLAVAASLILIASYVPVKAMALLCMEYIIHPRGAGEERPWTALLLTLALGSLSGIPLSITMVGLWLLIVAAIAQNAWWLALLVVVAWLAWLFKLIRPIIEFYRPPASREEVGVYAERRNITWLLGIALLGLSGLVITAYAQTVLIDLVPRAIEVLAYNTPGLRPSALGGLVDLPYMIWLPLTLFLFAIVLVVPPPLAHWLERRRTFTALNTVTPTRDEQPQSRRRGRIRRARVQVRVVDIDASVLDDQEMQTLVEEAATDIDPTAGQPEPRYPSTTYDNKTMMRVLHSLRRLIEPRWLMALIQARIDIFAAAYAQFCAVQATRYYVASTLLVFLAIIFFLSL